MRPADSTDAARGYAYTSKGNGLSVAFGKRSEVANDRPVLRVANEDKAVTLTALGANPSGMAVSGSKVRYTGAYADVDLSLTVDNERVKEDVIIKKAPANAQAAQFKYDLDLEGVTASKQSDNTVLFSDSSGKVVFRVPAPFMTDSSGDPERGYSDEVSVTLSPLGSGKVRLEFTPDLAWLQDPARVYPVTLDPTVEQVVYAPDGTTGQDASIYEASPWNTSTYGSISVLDVGKRPTDGYRRDSLIQFPELSNLPQDSVVTSTTLKLYAPSGTAGMPMEVWRNTEVWDEATVTWANAPYYTTYAWDSVSSTAPGWNTFDVGDLMHHVVSGEYVNRGVRVASTGAVGNSVPFVSSDSMDAAHHPQLVVRYVPATRYGFNGVWTYKTTEYGGGNLGSVNVSTGNLVLQHVDAGANNPGVDLTLTYNSQDPYGQSSYFERPGAYFGEGWTLSQNQRLYQVGDGGMVFKDGAGVDHVYATVGSIGRYFPPANYPHILTKDTSKPSTDPRVYKLAPNSSDTDEPTYYFDGEGKLTSLEGPDSNNLTYSYDSAGRLITITDGTKSVRLDYNGIGGRLSQIQDMSDRVSTYSYSTHGNLRTIIDGVGTTSEAITNFTYSMGNHLMSVTPPGGGTSNFAYKVQYDWDTRGVVADLQPEGNATGVSQSTEHYYGTVGGSLKLDLNNVTSSTAGSAVKTFSTPETWNSTQQDLYTLVYVPSGFRLNARIMLRDSSNRALYGPWWAATGGAWTVIRLPDAHVAPNYKVNKVGVQFVTPADSLTGYSGPVWVDKLMVKGVASQLINSGGTTTAEFRYTWDARRTTAESPLSSRQYSRTYSYDGYGLVTDIQVSTIPGCGT